MFISADLYLLKIQLFIISQIVTLDPRDKLKAMTQFAVATFGTKVRGVRNLTVR